MTLTFASLAILLIYHKYTCISYLQTLQCYAAVSKLLDGKSWVRVQKSPTVSLTLPQLAAASNQGVKQVVLQYAHDQ